MGSDSSNPGKPSGPGGPSVIVVDDHSAVRFGIKCVVEAEPGFRLAGEAADPAAALALAEAVNPDLAVVDLVYPSGTGFDLIKDLKVRCPDCRAVAYTALDGPGYAEQCLRAGAVAFVAKSEPAGNLVRALRSAREGRAYVSEDRAGELLARLSRGGGDPARPAVDRLSPGEFQVFHLIGQGLSNQQIAAQLHRSVKTVETYRSRIKRKLGVENATQLAQTASAACGTGAAAVAAVVNPVVPPPAAHAGFAAGAGPAATPRAGGFLPGAGGGRRANVLVVDDHAEIRRPMTKLLRLRGYDAREARDGMEALAALEDEPADVVLLDLMMPNMGGLALLERLRADDRWRSLPVVVLTGAADEQVLGQVRALTRHLVVKASCDPDVLFARVDAAVAGVLQ